MTEREQMKTALIKILEPELKTMRFSGEFPHYRSENGDDIHLLSVVFDKWGSSFALDVSYARLSGENTNTVVSIENINTENLTIYKTKEHLRLPADESWLSFCDMIKVTSEKGETLYSLTQKQKQTFLKNLPDNSYKIQSVAGEGIYEQKAKEAVQLLPQAVLWLENNARIKTESLEKTTQKEKQSLLKRLFHKKKKTTTQETEKNSQNIY